MKHQENFFNIIKALIPSSLSLAHEMSDLLKISLDSAYRRIRCETPLSLEETVELCFRFDVPLEALNSEIPNVVTFHYRRMYDNNDSMYNYLVELQAQLHLISSASKSHIVYAAEDIPVFHHFQSDELIKFKIFYWKKSILNYTSLMNVKYDSFQLTDEELAMCKSIQSNYSKVSSVEVWTEETCMSTIQQIRFYWDAGFFSHKNEAISVCDALQNIIQEIQLQAEVAMKKTGHSFNGVAYNLYVSDLMIGNNCVAVQVNDRNSVFLGYHSFNFVRTQNKDFAHQNNLWIENLLRKSTLISGVAEKQRNQFFKSIQKQIDMLKEHIQK